MREKESKKDEKERRAKKERSWRACGALSGSFVLGASGAWRAQRFPHAEHANCGLLAARLVGVERQTAKHFATRWAAAPAKERSGTSLVRGRSPENRSPFVLFFINPFIRKLHTSFLTPQKKWSTQTYKEGLDPCSNVTGYMYA